MKNLNKHIISYINARILDPSQGYDGLGGVITSGKTILDAKPNLFKIEYKSLFSNWVNILCIPIY